MIINHQLINEDYPKSIAKLNGANIDNVEVFCYLGCNIKYNEPGVGDSELEFRKDCAESKFYELGKKFRSWGRAAKVSQLEDYFILQFVVLLYTSLKYEFALDPV